MYVPVFGEEIYTIQEIKKDMVVCNYGGRYATGEGAVEAAKK